MALLESEVGFGPLPPPTVGLDWKNNAINYVMYELTLFIILC